MYTPIHKAEDTKFEKSLLNHHRELLKSWMNNETNFTNSQKRKILNLYDFNINENNVRYYLMRKIEVFTKALVTDQLHKIKNYAKNLREEDYGTED